jgi:hypothetical protein
MPKQANRLQKHFKEVLDLCLLKSAKSQVPKVLTLYSHLPPLPHRSLLLSDSVGTIFIKRVNASSGAPHSTRRQTRMVIGRHVRFQLKISKLSSPAINLGSSFNRLRP